MKPIRNHSSSRRGWIIFETILAIVILGILLGGWFVLQAQIASFNAAMHARRDCVAAADAQLECIAISGKPLDKERVQTLWRGVTCDISRESGTGQWKGLTLVTVSAETQAGGNTVQATLARYMEVQP